MYKYKTELSLYYKVCGRWEQEKNKAEDWGFIYFFFKEDIYKRMNGNYKVSMPVAQANFCVSSYSYDESCCLVLLGDKILILEFAGVVLESK